MAQRNSTKANPKKIIGIDLVVIFGNFVILGKTSRQSIMFNINQIKVEESQKAALLSLTINNRLTFKDHVDMLCSTANYKLHTLRRIRKYLTLEKTRLLYKAFINS